jgi:hypothetical protein
VIDETAPLAEHAPSEGSPRAWDNADPLNPQPLFYPVCSECHVAYVYRRFLSFATGGHVWAWARDCKHKKAPMETVQPA